MTKHFPSVNDGPHDQPNPGDQLGYVAQQFEGDIPDDADIEAVNPEVQAQVEYFFWQMRQK